MNTKKTDEFKISDIKKDHTLSIVATLDSNNIEMPAEYAHLSAEELAELRSKYDSEILPLENIVTTIQEKMLAVSFKGHVSKIDLIVVNQEGVYRWSNVKVYRIKLKSGKMVNLVTSKQRAGEKFNRRRGVRIDLDKAMKLEQEGQTYTVVVRDLSYCGVSFVEPNGSQLQKGMPFLLNLVDSTEKGDKEIGKITGKILNQRTLDSGAVVSGCIVSADHAQMLQRYIAIKQMEQISGRKSNRGLGIQKLATGEDWQIKLADAIEATMDK